MYLPGKKLYIDIFYIYPANKNGLKWIEMDRNGFVLFVSRF